MAKLKTDFLQSLFYDAQEQRIGMLDFKTNVFRFLCARTTSRNEQERSMRANLGNLIGAKIDKRKLEELHSEMRPLGPREQERLNELANKQADIIAEAIEVVGKESWGFQRDLVGLLIETE